MGLTVQGRNDMLDAFRERATIVSLHSAAPGENGANELSGGGYARQSITWNAPSAGSMSSSNTPQFSVGAGVTVTHVGFYSADSPTEFIAWVDVTDETFGGAGSYTITSATVTVT